jgi:hypothetical protein
MDQKPPPEANIIGLLGKKKKLQISAGTEASFEVKKKPVRYGLSCTLCILLCTASSGHGDACHRVPQERLLADFATAGISVGGGESDGEA